VPIALLLLGESPRLGGQDAEHVLRLAEAEGPLPPVLVERRGLRVIDGIHRVMAAMLTGRDSIEVEYFDGAEADAFLRAVESNTRHGLPLSRADRHAAVERILGSHPHLSDRAIAQVAGLGARTVADIRSRCHGAASDVRVGLDGKTRQADPEVGRREVVRLLAERPQSSLRQIARAAGVSPSTVSNLRRRLEQGEQVLTTPMPVPRSEAADAGVPSVDPAMVLQKLVRDPSLRGKEEGRRLLRLLQLAAAVEQERRDLVAAVPTHCTTLVRQLALQYADTWATFARDLSAETHPVV
jgi:ParB-like chromosome segregation protein Spo0J